MPVVIDDSEYCDLSVVLAQRSSSAFYGRWLLRLIGQLFTYAELDGLPMAEIRDELSEFVPADDPPGTLGEWLVKCDEDG